MEGIEASIAAVIREKESVEKALSGLGNYLGLSLGGGGADGEREGVRKELLMHLQALRAEKKQLEGERAEAKTHERERDAKLLDEKAKEKAHEREKEAKLLDETAKEKAHERDEKAKERALEREKELFLLRLDVKPPAAGASSHRAGSSCAKAFGIRGVFGKVMELVGQGEYAFVATVCKEWRSYYIVAHPAKTSQMSVVASIERVYWARRHGYKLTEETVKAAARHGDMIICKALQHMGLPRTACSNAAQKGDLPLIKLLLSDEVDAPFDHNVWINAAQGGHIPVLAWLLKHPKVRAELEAAEPDGGCYCWREGAGFAAASSQPAALRWMHANAREFCEWDAWVCIYAVRDSHSLEMLQWLRSEEVGCAWDGGVCPVVIRREHEADGIDWYMEENVFQEMKQWIHANGHPCDCED